MLCCGNSDNIIQYGEKCFVNDIKCNLFTILMKNNMFPFPLKDKKNCQSDFRQNLIGNK